MATANFRPMINGFDLYALETEFNDEENNSILLDIAFDRIQREVNLINDGLSFYELQLLDGYYTGIQMYVKDIREENNDLDFVKKDNEREWLRDMMEKTGEDWGFIKLRVVGQFSNGEALYERMKGEKNGK